MTVAQLIERDLGIAVDDGTFISELPMDSLEYLNLLHAIRDEVGSISIDDASRCITVGELAQAVRVPA